MNGTGSGVQRDEECAWTVTAELEIHFWFMPWMRFFPLLTAQGRLQEMVSLSLLR